MGTVYGSSDIRNIAVLGHGGCGKTTLVDAMCFIAGSTTRRGSVENGTAHTDFTPEEHDHGISINLAVARAEWMGTKLNLIDTPGYLDFFGEVEAGVRVVDGGLVVVSATSGVEVGTERVWAACARRSLPRMLFVSMIDRENASFEKCFEQIRDTLSGEAIPVEVPIGSGDGFRGIVNLFSNKAHIYKTGSAKGDYEETEIPSELLDTVETYREQLIETIATTDDELLEAYLEGEELDREKVLAAMSSAMWRGELFPIFCGSGETGRGVRAVMNKLVELMPSPVDAGSVEASSAKGDVTELKPLDSEPLAAIVFKTTQEPRVGELTYFRVFSGSVRGGITVSNPGRAATERLTHPAIPDGGSRSEVEVLHAGDIGVVAKLKDTHTGDTLCEQGKDLRLAPINWPKPDIAIAIFPASRGEEDRLANGLNRVHEEDPTFIAAFDPELGQTIAHGLGELHLNVAMERLKRKFSVNVETEAPRIAYRETITKKAQGQGRYKKQTGGRGQYGDCWLRLAPRTRGEGFEFISKIVGGVIPSKFVPAVGKGVQEALARGILAGYPVVDVAVECYDGSYHAVDSSEQAFKVAGSMAFQKVAREARPIILEPILEVEVRTPEEFMGEVIGDLNQRRGRIMGMDTDGHWQVVKAKVPQSEMYRYSTALRSLTQGKGAHARDLTGYEPAPADVTQKIIAEAAARKEAENH
ncbi:MAG: elongation factor G [Gemmatimonadetes bacterium]|nr:elongation factor G [Gemmatimonadota bacterium]NNK49635.1 elongation factor G [Gemmatimonadota bacterium]